VKGAFVDVTFSHLFVKLVFDLQLLLIIKAKFQEEKTMSFPIYLLVLFKLKEDEMPTSLNRLGVA
jgi:hypothetical protein